MDKISIAKQTLSIPEQFKRPCPPSWIDQLNDWVSRLPLPAWMFYPCLWFLFIIIENGSKWLDGVEPFGKLRWISVLYTFYGVYFLAAIHYLDTWAKTAFQAFRPILVVSEEEQSLLCDQLTTMPARIIWIFSITTLGSVIVLFRPLLMPLWEAMGFFHHSITSTLVDLGLFYFNALVIVIFVYHTLRQLRWGSRVHKTATHINLFQLRPLYSLSGLTARTAGVLVLVGFLIGQQSGTHGIFTADSYALRTSSLFTLISIIIYSLLAMAVFFLPLLGLHQLLLKEKERLLAEVDSRLLSHIQFLHSCIDDRQLQDAPAINSHLASLALERDILAKLPTWPWQPGTLNLLLTAVLSPIIIWFLQQILIHWTGFK